MFIFWYFKSFSMKLSGLAVILAAGKVFLVLGFNSQIKKSSVHTDDRRRFLSQALTGAVPLIAFLPYPAVEAKFYYIDPPGASTRDMFRSPEVRAKVQASRDAEGAEGLAKRDAKDPTLIAARKKSEEEDATSRKAEEEKERKRLEGLYENPPDSPRILILGGTGTVGRELRQQFKKQGIFVVATSRDGRDGTVMLDVTKCYGKIEDEVKQLAKENRVSAVVSCIGGVGTGNDLLVNGATGQAAIGARDVKTVRNFVTIGASPSLYVKVPNELKDYTSMKKFSQSIITNKFKDGKGGYSYTIVNPGAIGTSKNYGTDPNVPLNTVVDAIIVGATGYYLDEDSDILDTADMIKAKAEKIGKVKELTLTTA